ncbi:type II toxin-antitoxin system ParD family antitoxin [Limimaricola cinnabarinus]|uniref:type II toxin-antitoxin system ParD family antitoxin n=1 Tax=Limimaricola cinnabarinus TaxID=1125964 RepID=UPI0039E4F38B
MATRNVVLTPQQDEYVQALVASGRFQNASEALRAGLRLLQAEEHRNTVLRAQLSASLDEALAGKRAPGSGEQAVRRAFATARQRHTEG